MTHSDLALAFHRVHPRIYELSGLRTGSVRDQMVRAVLIVERLHGAGVIGPDRPLLVVGGGAAGMVAAWTASELDVACFVIEREPSLLATQESVPTRTIDPTEYDWPHPHWIEGRFPYRPLDQPLPLPFERGMADQVALRWKIDFQNWVRSVAGLGGSGYGSIAVQHRWELSRQAAGTGLLCQDLDVAPGAPPVPIGGLAWDDQALFFTGAAATVEPRRFAAALSCVGFGDENVTLDAPAGESYAGPRFWSEDRFAQKDAGFATLGGWKDALVSGGGDGAQQDVQRLLTRRCGRDLVLAIEEVDPAFRTVEREAALAWADDEGRRAHAWSSPHRVPHAALLRWHQAYQAQAATVWERWERQDLVDRLIEKVLRESITLKLTWMPGSVAPSYSFGLNRLLTLLVLHLHARQTGRPACSDDPPERWRRAGDGRPVLWTGYRLSRCEPLGHQCRKGQSCIDQRHRLFCKVDGKDAYIDDFDLVVVRHGMHIRPLFGQPPVPEQLTPMSFPE